MENSNEIPVIENDGDIPNEEVKPTLEELDDNEFLK